MNLSMCMTCSKKRNSQAQLTINLMMGLFPFAELRVIVMLPLLIFISKGSRLPILNI